MDRDTIDRLNQLNARFYRENCASFDQTRQSAWPGWTRVVEHLKRRPYAGRLHLLDIACGNLRFEKYLTEMLPEIELQATCVDSCDELAVPMKGCNYRHDDIVESIAQADLTFKRWGQDFDVVVSFGFFHHVPSSKLRAQLLEELIEVAAPHGLIAVSLWRFASDEKMRAKAERTTAEALISLELAGALEEGDYLIGWNDVPDVYRYCHSFCDLEIDELIAGVASRADLEDRYRADGRTDSLNEYLLLRKR